MVNEANLEEYLKPNLSADSPNVSVVIETVIFVWYPPATIQIKYL